MWFNKRRNLRIHLRKFYFTILVSLQKRPQTQMHLRVEMITSYSSIILASLHLSCVSNTLLQGRTYFTYRSFKYQTDKLNRIFTESEHVKSIWRNLLKFLLRCGAKLNKWGPQWDSNSLLSVCFTSLPTISLPEMPNYMYIYIYIYLAWRLSQPGFDPSYGEILSSHTDEFW